MSFALPATVTFDEASAVLRTIERAVQDAQGALRVDASALSTLDTGVLALLLQARRLAAARGLGFELLGAPEQMLALARLYGVESLLGLPAAASLAAGAATTA